MRYAAFCALLLAAGEVHAQTIYKCEESEGKAAYQSEPCPSESTELWVRDAIPQQKSQPSPEVGRGNTPPPARRPAPGPATEEEIKRGFKMVSTSFRVTERNSTWWRFAWLARIKNLSSSAKVYRAEIQFTVADGFAIDEGRSDRVAIQPGAQATISEFELIRTPGAARVSGARINVEQLN